LRCDGRDAARYDDETGYGETNVAEHHREVVGRELAEHERTIEALHHRLSSVDGVDKAKLTEAVAKYKKAHKAFHDDCLECGKG
jgi:hypothetical protein